MEVYLAARYGRIEEMNAIARELRDAGYAVDARWLLGEHQIHDGALAVETAEDAMPPEGRAFAQDDVEDLVAADIVISFTETPRSSNSRGGRHVEFGMALALGKRLIVVGPRENVFHCLPEVEVYRSWDEAKEQLYILGENESETDVR